MIITKYALFLCVSIWLMLSCQSKQHEPNETASDRYCLDATFKQSVEFISPELRQVTEGIPLTGTVMANPDKVIHFISLVGGIVSNTYFSLGDAVAKGQVLADLRSTDLTSMQSELKALESQIKVSENKLLAVQSMFEDGISSQRDLLEAQSEVNILKADYERVTANLNLYSASTEKGVFQIKAPASGIITAKAIAAGSQISAEGEPLFTISDLSEVWVMVNIYATNIRNIEEGMQVDIRTLSYPGEIFPGKVGAISQVYDAEAKVLKARVVLPNSNLRLKPGMLVDVTARRVRDLEALTLPTQALVFDDNLYFAIVYKSDCDLEIRKVDVLSKSNGTTYLLGGVSEHDQVIARNQLLIYEQLKNFQY